MRSSNHFDVIVIGGGASGLMCAITAGQRGRRVLVLEGSNKVGKKILMSGGGRCNFTNLDVLPKNFISNNPRFCISALKRYTQWDFIALVDKYKIPYGERDLGKLFCLDSAKDILNMLLAEIAAAGVTIEVNRKAISIKALLSGGFSVDEFTCESLVVACGGLSIPTMGASGFGYEVARQFGHTVLPTRAGLVPFTFSDKFKDVSERLSGLAVDADLSCKEASFNEAVLFTHRGLSGPAALQLSNYWQTGETVNLNLFPNESAEELLDWLLSLKRTHPKSLLRTLLAEHPTVRLAKSLVLELQAELWEKDGFRHAETPIAQIPDAVLALIGRGLQAWQQKPSGTEGYRTAEVTLGGVDTTELSSKTMESSKQAGLYFVGEVVDVSGHLGGYNFQWAWASGHAAGEVA
ncbi:MAG: hypothetical protein RLY82_1434 [Pseudomonadota bacterium]